VKRYAPALFFLALVLAFLWRSTIGGQVLLPGGYLVEMQPWNAAQVEADSRQWDPIQWDSAAQFFPWRAFYSRSIREGTLPLWNPHQFCGTPFAANGQSAVFYPPNLLYALIAPDLALGWSAALHLFLAGLFTFLLIRSLGAGNLGAYIGGISYAFGAFMITWLELPTLVNAAAWLPLVLLLIHNAAHSGRILPTAGAGAVIALATLAGHLQIAMYIFLMAGAWWLWLIARETRVTRRPGRQIGLAALTFVIAFLIAAPQLLPTLELSGMSHRVRHATAEGFMRYQDNAVPPHNLVTMLVPDFYGNPSRGDYWGGVPYAEYALYMGILPLFLAFLGGIYGIRHGQHAKFFAAAAIVCLLSAFGALINALTYFGIPGFAALGGPNRIILLYMLSTAVLAGIGADWFAGLCGKNDAPACERDFRSTFRPAIASVSAVALLYAIAFALAISAFQRLNETDTLGLITHIRPQIAIFGVLFLGGTALLLLRGAARMSRKMFTILAITLLVADLFAFGMGYNPVCSRDVVSQQNPAVEHLRSVAGDERIMPLNPSWSLYNTPPAVWPPNASMLYGLYDVQGYDSLYTRYYKDFADGLQGEDSSPIENGNIIFFKHYSPEAADLARFIISAQPIEDPRLLLVSQDGVWIYENPEAMPFAAVTNGEVHVTHRGANRVEMDVSADTPGKLTVAQTYYPGWKAYVGGKETPVERNEQIFQQVDMPAGEHNVVLSFEPGSVRAGYWLAAFGMLLVIGAFVVNRRENRQ
jgi:hypothetical protein